MSLGLTATMKWWEEWQLRILVLGSLLIQFILLLAPFLRRTRYRSIIWLAYVVGDALAIYALATLFSLQKLHKTDAGIKESSLEVIWVPVLLIHLGGQPYISAYSLEDNELWRRHVVTLVTQVAVAIYSFYKWWFGDVKLLVAAILLFILGIIKYAAKPWGLRKASFASLQAASSSLSPRKKQGAVAAWWTRCTSMYREWVRDEAEAVNKNSSREARQECESLEEYVREATKAVKEEVEKRMKAVQEDIEAADNNQQGLDDLDWIIFGKAINKQPVGDAAEAGWDEGPIRESVISHTNYFVDVIAPYSVRLRELRSFVKLDGKNHTIKLKLYINAKGTNMYTNLRTVSTRLGCFLHKFLFPCLAMASVVFFAFSHKDGYSVKDIMVTYILFSCTCLLEFYDIMCVIFERLFRIGYRTPLRPGFVFQYNLLSYYARKKEPTFVMKLAILDFLRDIVNKRWYIGEVQTAVQIRIRVLRHVMFGWNKYIQGDAAQYKRFNDMRGQLVLNRHEPQMARMGWSVSTRFDESVLLWHIATDLCFYCRDKSPQGGGGAAATTPFEEAILVTRSISNYMIYLFLDQPEMLIPGARSALFSIASDSIDELSLLLGKGDYSAPNGEERIARAIIQAATQTKEDEEDTLVTRACKLAKVLMEELLDEKKRWRVIHGMWIEMLCYSISRRRGFLQAKYMCDRADSLNLVWVLWAFMGMETWVERYHRLDHSEQDGGERGRAGKGEYSEQDGGGRGQAGKGEYCVGESSSGSLLALTKSRTQELMTATEAAPNQSS